MQKRFICTVALLIFILNTANAQVFQLAKYQINNNPLNTIPKDVGVVTIIPYYVQNNKIYIFLSQEINKHHNGIFTDFTKQLSINGPSVLQQALQTINAGTLSKVRINADYLLRNGFLMLSKTPTQQSYYLFLKLDAEKFKKTQKINIAKTRLQTSCPPEHFKKVSFLWVDLQDLVQGMQNLLINSTQNTTPTPIDLTTQKFPVQTLNGQELKISISYNLIENCLQNPNLEALIRNLR